MKILNQITDALSYGFRPAQMYNRALYELSSRLRPQSCLYHPVWLHFYVSSRCNFRCRFCTNHAAGETGKVDIGYHEPVKDLTLPIFKQAIDMFDRAMVCTFCGVGEPFLNSELFEMIAYAKSKKIITEVITNGSFLGPEERKKILKTGLDRLTISLLESDEEAYEHIIDTKKKYFNGIKDAISSLVAIRNANRPRPEIKISRVLTQTTLSRAEDFIKLGIKLNVDKVVFHNLIFSEITSFELSECLFDEQKTAVFFNELEAKYHNLMKIEFPTLIKRNRADKKPSCNWYWKNMCIDASGNISGCGRFITPKAIYGRFTDKDAWNNSHFQEMRRTFIKNEILECCSNCVESSR